MGQHWDKARHGLCALAQSNVLYLSLCQVNLPDLYSASAGTSNLEYLCQLWKKIWFLKCGPDTRKTGLKADKEAKSGREKLLSSLLSLTSLFPPSLAVGLHGLGCQWKYSLLFVVCISVICHSNTDTTAG